MATIEIIAALIGLLYLWLEYRASIWLWLVGFLMPFLYIYIFYQSKFYADMAINVYYLGANVYGWYCWKKKKAAVNEKGITHLPIPYVRKLVLVAALLFGLISWVLVRYTDNAAPYGNAFTTALSVVAMWMLARKYVEQWLVWVVVNAVSAGLYFWKGLYPTGLLFAIYTVVSIFGYMKWRRTMYES